MSSQWWRVKHPVDPMFLVLVVGGRVAVTQKSYGFVYVGWEWARTRALLEKYLFKCTAELELE